VKVHGHTNAGKWRDPDIPETGWKFVGMCDLEFEHMRDETIPSRKRCERECGASIRYVHRMVHERKRLRMEVGCTCAGNMEDDPKAADERQKTFESTAQRASERAKTLSKNWDLLRSIDIDQVTYYGLLNQAIAPLDRLSAEAALHVREAEADLGAFPSDGFCAQRDAHVAFVEAVKEALDRAGPRLLDLLPLKAGEELEREINDAETKFPNPPWRRTMNNNYQLRTSQGDVALVFYKPDGWHGHHQRAGTSRPSFSPKSLGYDVEQAMHAVLRALRRTIRKNGRLPI
jgi:hypothetical protein